MLLTRRNISTALVSVAALSAANIPRARAASATKLDLDGKTALENLFAKQPHAAILAAKAKAILVFPSILKAGFLVGAQTGNGVFFHNGMPNKYYNISSASFGLQGGVQSFSYALFFMKESAIDYLAKSGGWSIGSGPSVVVLDKGAAASFSSTTLTQDVYAVPFGQHGLMAGIGLEGSKITAITPDP
jgi:lipid-binding SYLF domain-containing protein